MTINRKNSGNDSATVRALVEQVSQIQEDINELGNEIDGLDQSKVSTVDLEASVTTETLTAGSAQIGTTNINATRLSSPDVRATALHSENADFEYTHANDGYIENLSADALTVSGTATATDITAETISASDSLESPTVNAETVSAVNVTASGNVSGNTVSASTTNATTINATTVNATSTVNVKDLNITGNVTGLNNVDVEANSITTPTIDAGTLEVGAIYTTKTSDDFHLVPTPHLDNNDHYTIMLPSFTGTVVLKWVDDGDNEVWSATVIGNGKDYEIHWGTVGETLVVQRIYQDNGHLYIRHNANGSLYYSYHTTDVLGEITVWYNYTALDGIIWDTYTHDCTQLSGTVSFGDFYAPSLVTGGESVFDNLVARESFTAIGDANLHKTTITDLTVATTETVIDPDTQEETPVTHTYFTANENGVEANGSAVLTEANKTDTITEDSADVITSGAVFDGLETKVDKTTTVNGHALNADVTVTKADVGLGNVVNTGDSSTPVENGTDKFTTGGAYTELNKKIDLTEKGASNGVATLDTTGRVPYSQLPESAMEYKGTWDASTNTPTLADGTGTNGDFYVVSVAGTVNFGTRTVAFYVNDRVIYDGSTDTWQRLPAGEVRSVNGQTGDVTLTASNVNYDTNTTIKAAIDAKQGSLTFDTTPTASSTNPVTSGGIKTYVDTQVTAAITQVLNTGF